MKRFRFRFEALYKQRKAKEDQAMNALGEAQRVYQAEIEQKNALMRELGKGIARREMLGDAGRVYAGTTDFQIEQDFIEGTKHRIIRAEGIIARAKKNVEKCLRVFLLARRNTRVIENLKEKELAEFKKQMAKREARELDELITLRYAHEIVAREGASSSSTSSTRSNGVANDET